MGIKKLMKQTFRGLVLVSQIGFNMVVPILVGGYLAGRYLRNKPFFMILVILFSVAVSFRNLVVFMGKEAQRPQKDDRIIIGRPNSGEDKKENKND